MLLDKLYKSLVLPWMFSHFEVSNPELPKCFKKQKVTLSTCWWITYGKDYSWHNINQSGSFILLILLFFGCSDLCWSQTSPVLSVDLLPSGHSASMSKPLLQHNQGLLKALLSWAIQSYLYNNTALWLQGISEQSEKAGEYHQPRFTAGRHREGNDLFEVIAQGGDEGREGSQESQLGAPLWSVSGAHRVVTGPSRSRGHQGCSGRAGSGQLQREAMWSPTEIN